MAFYSGFFNAKGMDRVYTAEDFTGYLSSIICDGVLDSYSMAFSLTAADRGLTVKLGTGKAWIDGHYFLNDAIYSIDLSSYVDESLPRFVAICIVCDTNENVRSVRLELVSGTPAEYPAVPEMPSGDGIKSLLLHAVWLGAGTKSLSKENLIDYRDDDKKCGYCRCILGKCKVTDMLAQLVVLNAQIDKYNETMEGLNNKIDALQLKIDDMTGDIVKVGQCGDDIYYVLYSDGKLLLRGTGEMYDYGTAIPISDCQYPDIDGDGRVTASDSSLILAADANIGSGRESGLTPEQELLADVNRDGKINAVDASLVLSFAAELGVGKYSNNQEGWIEFLNDQSASEKLADGHSMGEIATILTEKKIMRRNGETAWTRTNVQKILTNEKYVGDALSQKSYTIDCLTHEHRKNSGEKTKYYLLDCHDAIIDRDTWDSVHLELARRSAETKGRHSGKKYCFSDLLTCPYCGGKYKHTIWKIGEKSVGVWRCGNRIDHGSRICSRGASLHEDKLQNTVVAAVNDMIENPEKVEEAIMETMNQFRTKITEIDTQLMDINTELERISARRDDILTVITGEAFEQFKPELKDLNSQELELKSKAEKLQIKRDNVQFSIKKAVTAKELFSNMLPLREFDDITIPKLIKRIDVTDKEHIRVIFCGGMETEVTVEK